MCERDDVQSAPPALALPLSASERAEQRRQKILSTGAERMSKVSGLYTKSSSEALGSLPQDAVQSSAFAAAPLATAQNDEASRTAPHAAAAPAAEAQVTEIGTQDDDSPHAVRRTQSAQDCALPSLRKMQLDSTSDHAHTLVPPSPRAPGVRAFQPTPAAAPVAKNTKRASPPLTRFFWWRAAVWALAAIFCAAVYAHAVQLLPPAPYVLILIAVTRCSSCSSCAMTLRLMVQAMAAVVVLSRFTVRALAYQATSHSHFRFLFLFLRRRCLCRPSHCP